MKNEKHLKPRNREPRDRAQRPADDRMMRRHHDRTAKQCAEYQEDHWPKPQKDETASRPYLVD